MHDVIQVAYLAAAILFIYGLRGMSSPRSARRGIVVAGVGMLVATIVTVFTEGFQTINFALMFPAIGVGSALA